MAQPPIDSLTPSLFPELFSELEIFHYKKDVLYITDGEAFTILFYKYLSWFVITRYNLTINVKYST